MVAAEKNNDTNILGAVVDGVKAWTGWLGAFAGGMSAISAVVRLFDVGLKPILQDFVGFYRGLIQPLVDLVQLALPWEVPLLAVDFSIVYLVLFGISLRTYYDIRGQRWKFSSHPTDHVRTFLRDLWDIASLGPVWTLTPVRVWYSARKRLRQDPLAAGSLDEDAQLEDAQLIDELWRYMDWDKARARSSEYRQQLIQFLIVPGALVVFFLLNAY